MSDYCKACDRTFAGTSAFDAHRIGLFGINRRCMTDKGIAEAKRKDGSLMFELRSNGKWGLRATEAQIASREALANQKGAE